MDQQAGRFEKEDDVGEDEQQQEHHDYDTRRLLGHKKKWIAEKDWLRHIRDCKGGAKDRTRLRHLLNLANTKKLTALATLIHHFAIGDADVPKVKERQLIKSKKINLLRQQFETERPTVPKPTRAITRAASTESTGPTVREPFDLLQPKARLARALVDFDL